MVTVTRQLQTTFPVSSQALDRGLLNLIVLMQRLPFAVIRNNQKFIKSYNYQNPGIYLIQVIATNLQGNTSAEHEIVVEHPVLKFWKLTNNSPKLLPEPVKFTLTYPEENILPTNATVIIQFGDKKRHIWRVPEDAEDWNGEFSVEHVYDRTGLYNVDVEISNVVSKMQKRFQVKRGEEIPETYVHCLLG